MIVVIEGKIKDGDGYYEAHLAELTPNGFIIDSGTGVGKTAGESVDALMRGIQVLHSVSPNSDKS